MGLCGVLYVTRPLNVDRVSPDQGGFVISQA
jgi:hypothetical protein